MKLYIKNMVCTHRILVVKQELEKLFCFPKAVHVEVIRFEYSAEKAPKPFEDSPLPNEYTERLRNGSD